MDIMTVSYSYNPIRSSQYSSQSPRCGIGVGLVCKEGGTIALKNYPLYPESNLHKFETSRIPWASANFRISNARLVSVFNFLIFFSSILKVRNFAQKSKLI